MKRILTTYCMMLFALCMMAQGEVLTLDSCRSRALVANKKIGMAKMKHQMAVNVRKAARTKYLPHIDLAGGYMYSSREISLLSDAQKSALGSMGSVSAICSARSAILLPAVIAPPMNMGCTITAEAVNR